MDWRIKCLALHALRYAPYSAHAFLQRKVTGRYYFDLKDEEFRAYNFHVDNFRRLPAGSRVIEFGAGSNLLVPLMLSAAGATEIFTYDVQRIATVDQVNHVIRQLNTRIPGDWQDIADLDQDLLRKYCIRYSAPGDARYTGLPKQSVDFFCSTSTLEHIPPLEIASILSECRRIATPNALFSFVIDYHDHYATADPRISRFNFYRYSERAWRWFNPSNHYQNRLRHSDYIDIFKTHLLDTMVGRCVSVSNSEIEGLPLSSRFQGYSTDDLVSLNGLFLLKCKA